MVVRAFYLLFFMGCGFLSRVAWVSGLRVGLVCVLLFVCIMACRLAGFLVDWALRVAGLVGLGLVAGIGSVALGCFIGGILLS